MTNDLDECLKILWDFNHMNHSLEPVDVIIGLGGYDTGIAKYSTDLYKKGLAPLILFTGKFGKFTKDVFDKSEAELFAEVAIQNGVPNSDILMEDMSTNTGENVLFSKKLLEEKDVKVEKIIVVSKPYMERRAYATFAKQWPGIKIMLSSEPVALEEYLSNVGMDKDMVINTIVADTQKIKIYPERGYQVYQEIPEQVWLAWQKLVAAGYDKYVV